MPGVLARSVTAAVGRPPTQKNASILRSLSAFTDSATPRRSRFMSRSLSRPAAVTDLANTPGIKIKLIDHAATVAAMNKKYGPLYIEDVIPKATYRGMDADNRQATVWNILVSHENLSNQTAYSIVKTIFDKREDMIAVHKEAEIFKLENQKAAASPIPFHPGAIKYFAERGVRIR